MDETFITKLNPQQKEAVKKTKGPSIILAGAGSGKTRVLVAKVIYLIKNHKINPSNILMITFTNKAAKEMKNRINLNLKSEKKLGFIGTFHSLCARILRIDGNSLGIDNRYVIYDESDQLKVVKKIIKENDYNDFTPMYALNRISSAKNEMISPTNFLKFFSDHRSKDIATIYSKYQNILLKNSALDFDDLLIKTIELFHKSSKILKKYQEIYKYILVDEFQDTNLVQYVLTKLLAIKNKNITVVGDFSQSIYSWRGADIKNLEKFKNDFPETVIFKLEKNYRSTQVILDFAHQVILKNKTHPILELTSEKEKGEAILFFEAENEQEEGVFIVNEIQRLLDTNEPPSIALLYRTNAQSRVLEEVFLHFSIPYTLIGGVRFYERREIKDIISYIRLFINPNDELSKDRIIKLGKRKWDKFKELFSSLKSKVSSLPTEQIINKIFESTGYLDFYDEKDPDDFSRLENIKELKSVAIRFPDIGNFLEQVALVESEYFESEKRHPNEEGIKLMTLHQSKGLEFDTVFITGVEEGLLPHSRSIDDFFQLEEERRLFYVGITRARHRLYILSAKKRFIFGRLNYSIKSRFISDDEDILF
ncbi:MAG: UvrD-helicase domain-containing protein [bacterium]|nr:UvrD-helicase domain-containing protein [bacterium]